MCCMIGQFSRIECESEWVEKIEIELENRKIEEIETTRSELKSFLFFVIVSCLDMYYQTECVCVCTIEISKNQEQKQVVT